jgi:hypothetical protein
MVESKKAEWQCSAGAAEGAPPNKRLQRTASQRAFYQWPPCAAAEPQR